MLQNTVLPARYARIGIVLTTVSNVPYDGLDLGSERVGQELGQELHHDHEL